MKGRGLLGLALLGVLGTLLAAGCTGSVAQPAIARAEVQRVGNPEVPQSDLATLADGNSAFAFDLYGALRKQDGNLFYSPYSISLALAMTYAGARGQTEEQMARTLHYTLPQDRLHPAFNALDQQVASRGTGARGQDAKGFRLRLANSLWGQAGYSFLPQYLESLAKDYGAGLRLLDFQKAAEAARITINDWVEEQTEGKIQNLLPQGTVSSLTRLVLVNAIYFNAAWKHPFTAQDTRPFTLADGRKVDAPTMSQTVTLPYTRGEGYQAVELPYDGGEISMLVLLPDTGGFERFEGTLDARVVDGAVQALQARRVALTMPKFKYESSFSLAPVLSEMGMPEAMSERADFSGMSGNRDLHISDVIHKAIVLVDEKGTEAAAATGVVVGVTSAMPMDQVTLTVDRPFLFLIRDVKTGTVLFVGRVLDPRHS